MAPTKSIWTVAVVAIMSAILFPAAGQFQPDAGNASTAVNVTNRVAEPLGNSLIGLLLLVAAVLTVTAILVGGEW